MFSLMMGWLVGFAGLLAGVYLWDRFGPRANDPDDTVALLFGVSLGGIMATGAAITLLWKLWPRSERKVSQSG